MDLKPQKNDLRRSIQPALQAAGRLMPSRRAFLRMAAVGAAAGVTSGLYAFQVEPRWVHWNEQTMHFPELPERLRGRLLLQVSDLHVGPRVETEFVRNTLLRAADYDPDWVVLTGDLVTWRGDWVLSELERVLEGTVRGRHGTFAVLGNHDYGRRWNDMGIAGLIEEVLARQGIQLLRNRWVAANGMVFAGVEDFWSSRQNLWQALAGKPEGPTVLLCHNPDSVNEPGWERVRGWILSGHTHGGQVNLPILGTPILPVRDRRFHSGHVELAGHQHLYINPGLGYGIPIRFRVRPEVTLFTLGQTPA